MQPQRFSMASILKVEEMGGYFEKRRIQGILYR